MQIVGGHLLPNGIKKAPPKRRSKDYIHLVNLESIVLSCRPLIKELLYTRPTADDNSVETLVLCLIEFLLSLLAAGAFPIFRQIFKGYPFMLRRIIYINECKTSAQVGYDIASAQYKRLHATIENAEEKIESTLLAFTTSTCYLSDATESLSQQLAETRSDLDRMSFAFRDDLQSQRENLGKFSITLFGRTMAGKSTLMEVLTHGDGSSIGRGAQRTTQDVREYYWNDRGIHRRCGLSHIQWSPSR